MPNEHGDMMDEESFERAIVHAKELAHILIMRGWRSSKITGYIQGVETMLRDDLYQRHDKQV